MTDRVRMTLDLSLRIDAEVGRLATSRDTSKASVLRFSVELLAAALDAKDAGYKIGAWSSDRQTEREFIGL